MGCDIHGVWQAKRDGKWHDVSSMWEQNRHYLLFSWLADVRNGYGFAGVPTYDPIAPIAQPRGLPDGFTVDGDTYRPASADALDPRRRGYRSPEELEAPEIFMGDHSHSWLTADEILSAKRPTTVHKVGIVSVEFARAWDGKTPPESWSGGIAGAGVEVAEGRAAIRPSTTHVRIEWWQPDGLDYFVDEVKRLQTEHGEVRLVFGFDS